MEYNIFIQYNIYLFIILPIMATIVVTMLKRISLLWSCARAWTDVDSVIFLHHTHNINFEITIVIKRVISTQSIDIDEESFETKFPTASVIISSEEHAVIQEKTMTLSGSNLSYLILIS